MDAAFPDHMMPEITKFFTTENSREPGRDVYDDVFAIDGFFPPQRKREVAKMMQIARSVSPKVVMEIGSDKGGGFYHWCKSLTTVKRAIAVEIRGCPYAGEFKKAFPHIDFLFEGRSSLLPETVAAVAKWLGEDKIDALFIDGDKSYFLRDLELYRPMMSPGAVAFMHDIQDPSPGRAFADAVKIVPRSERVIDVSESREAEAREAAGEPAASSHEHWLRHWKGQSCGVGVLYV